MGEIGWKEDEFLQLDKHWKIKVVIRGYRRRSRESWMQSRLIMWMVSRVAGGKAESPEELLPLPFDTKRKTSHNHSPEEDEQLKKLIAECQEYNRQQEEKQKKNRAEFGS